MVLPLKLTLLALCAAVSAAQAPASKKRAARAKTPAAASATKKPADPAASAPGESAAAAPAVEAQASMPAPKPRTKVAVLELSGLGITDITKNLEQYLRNSIATIDGFQMLSAADVQIALQDPKNREVASCGGGPDCGLEVGRLVAADVVIIGSITGFGEVFGLNLRALDVKRSRELGRYQANVSGRDKLIPEVRLAAYRLVAPHRIRGWLVVETDVEGVEVEVDGTIVGATPLSQPIENLTPGEHVVVLKRAGFKPLRQKVAIRPFEPTRLAAALETTQK